MKPAGVEPAGSLDTRGGFGGLLVQDLPTR